MCSRHIDGNEEDERFFIWICNEIIKANRILSRDNRKMAEVVGDPTCSAIEAVKMRDACLPFKSRKTVKKRIAVNNDMQSLMASSSFLPFEILSVKRCICWWSCVKLIVRRRFGHCSRPFCLFDQSHYIDRGSRHRTPLASSHKIEINQNEFE